MPSKKFQAGLDDAINARQRLEPILRSPVNGDEVFRALPIATASNPGEDPLSSLHRDLLRVERYFSEPALATLRRINYTLPVVGVAGAALFYVAQHWEGAAGQMGFWSAMSFVAAVLFMLAAVAVWPIATMATWADRYGPSITNARTRLAEADLSGLIEVINPDEATALALDRARAHTLTTRGAALERARRHYYDLLVEVSTGAAGTSAGSREEQWRDAWTRWCAIDDAWTDLMCDPLAALNHAELLDVTLPRTGAFLTSYADTRQAMTGRTSATVPADLAHLLRLVAETETAWVEAREHAAHAGYAWLPEEERAKAVTAEKALTRALDTRLSMGERANAATQASRLLAEITTVQMPEKARGELAHIARKAITAGHAPTEDIVVGAPILREARLAQPA